MLGRGRVLVRAEQRVATARSRTGRARTRRSSSACCASSRTVRVGCSGMGADVGGYVFEALALGVGTLVLVQPILSTSLLLSMFLGGVINGRHISRAGWTAAVVLAMGVGVFLYMVAPTQGIQVASNRSWLIAAPPIIGFVLGCCRVGADDLGGQPRRVPRPGRGNVVRYERRAHEGIRALPRWRRPQLGPALGALRARGELHHRTRPRAERVPDRLARRRGRAPSRSCNRSPVSRSASVSSTSGSSSRARLGTLIVGAALIAMLGGVLMLARVEHPEDESPHPRSPRRPA